MNKNRFMNPDNFILSLKKGQVPPLPINCEISFTEEAVKRSMELTKYRRIATQQYVMWAMVDKVWTKELAEWIGNRTCLEIMSGV